MQRQLTLGFIVAATVGLGACGGQEVDPRRRMPPTAAAAGSGGGAGSGSMSQGGTDSGTGGNAGSAAGTAGTSSGAPPPCTGCIEMVVPVSPLTPAALQQAMFNFVFTGTGVDMSNGTITFRLRSTSLGADLFVTPFAQNGDPYPGVYRPQTLLTETNGFSETDENAWVDIVLDLANTAPLGGAGPGPTVDAGADAGGAAPPVQLDNGGMDKRTIAQLGLQVGALATLAAADTITLLIDSVTFAGVNDPQAAARDFNDNTPQGFVLTNFQVPTGTTGPTPH